MVQFPFSVERVQSLDVEPQEFDVGHEQRASERRERAAQLVGAPRAFLAFALVREEVTPAVD